MKVGLCAKHDKSEESTKNWAPGPEQYVLQASKEQRATQCEAVSAASSGICTLWVCV